MIDENYYYVNDTTNKIRKVFQEMAVYKDLKNTNFISAFKLPSFMRDWVLQRFQNIDGEILIDDAVEFVKTYIPIKEDWKAIQNRIVFEYDDVKILAKISIKIDVNSGEITFSLPDFSLDYKKTTIPHNVWEQCSESLLKAEENWGMVKLGYQPPSSPTKKDGKIKLLGFKDFCPYTVDLEQYKEARKEFSLDEWMDVILGAIDYNPQGYESENQKRAVITRLLPFVEKRLNLIELAPKGTGKSYLFGSVSRYGWLSSGGIMSRAKMFYDMSRRNEGIVFGRDYVALDEVQTISFTDVDEMRGALKGYMENGRYKVGDHEGQSDAGIVLLGNISITNMDEYKNMFVELPTIFKESALIDRFHGFIKGWEMPRMNEELKASGWSLNSEYFCSIMHELRNDPTYRNIVDNMIIDPPKADTRDTEAIKRIATGYMKLLFPHVTSVDDISPIEFKKNCLKPAMKMRAIIKSQLGILDEEYRGKSIPKFEVRGL